jgi:hypothetical protein
MFLMLSMGTLAHGAVAGTWALTGSMSTTRCCHTATPLPDGRVLVSGGLNSNSAPLASAELYDPTLGTWALTGPMSTPRQFHTVTPLPDGRVLVSGGLNSNSAPLASAEIYDPALGTWALTGPMSTPRCCHTTTLLPDGRVLVSGGLNSNSAPLASAEIYDPALGTWALTGSMLATSSGTATLLSDGRVLVSGASGGSLAEIYDPALGTWAITGSMSTPRLGHPATRLPDGRVLVSGGNSGGGALATAELYDPTLSTWALTGPMSTAREFHPATPLPDGRVLVSGGHDGRFALASAEIFSQIQPPTDLTMVAAVLPISRSVRVGTSATAFATAIVVGTGTATGCTIAPLTSVAATFAYQATNPATNQVTGAPNTPVDIPGGSAQTFVVAFTPTAPFPPTDINLLFTCTNANPAAVTSGLNTLLLSASVNAVPDIVALGATLNSDGIVNIPGATGTGVFAVATVNVGAGGSIAVSADTGGTSLPVTLLLCQTNPVSGACLAAPTSTVTTQMNANATPSFGIFVAGIATVPFDPAKNRIFVRFKDAGAVTRGATSVAVRTR